MKWNTRAPTEPQPWKRWFAWYPITIDLNTYVWLEWVERQKTWPYSHTREYSYYNHRELL